jgi:hypothetical protein
MLFKKITIRLNQTPFQNQQVIKGLSYYFPHLFIIGVELLSLKLKRNPDIQGITINDDESLSSQYADVKKNISVIRFKSIENSIPKSLKFECDQ